MHDCLLYECIGVWEYGCMIIWVYGDIVYECMIVCIYEDIGYWVYSLSFPLQFLFCFFFPPLPLSLHLSLPHLLVSCTT